MLVNMLVAILADWSEVWWTDWIISWKVHNMFDLRVAKLVCLLEISLEVESVAKLSNDLVEMIAVEMVEMMVD